MILKEAHLDNYQGCIRSACGTKLNAPKQIKNLELQIGGISVTGNVIVTQE
jgi:hypothetical protein